MRCIATLGLILLTISSQAAEKPPATNTVLVERVEVPPKKEHSLTFAMPGPRAGLQPGIDFLAMSDGVGDVTGEQLPIFDLGGRAAQKPFALIWGWLAPLDWTMKPKADLRFFLADVSDSTDRYEFIQGGAVFGTSPRTPRKPMSQLRSSGRVPARFPERR